MAFRFRCYHSRIGVTSTFVHCLSVSMLCCEHSSDNAQTHNSAQKKKNQRQMMLSTEPPMSPTPDGLFCAFDKQMKNVCISAAAYSSSVDAPTFSAAPVSQLTCRFRCAIRTRRKTRATCHSKTASKQATKDTQTRTAKRQRHGPISKTFPTSTAEQRTSACSYFNGVRGKRASNSTTTSSAQKICKDGTPVS